MHTPGSHNVTRALPQVFASGRWIHEDGELVVASEIANPELRGVLASQAVMVASLQGVGSRESGVGKNTATRDCFDDFAVAQRGPWVTHVCESLHFAVYALDDVIAVLHRLEPAAIDNDLAELVAGELIRPGHVAVLRAFERCFAGVVLSSALSSKDAWHTFYGNTLSKLRQVASGSYPGRDSGPVAVFGRIYEHARELVVGSSLLDVGTCFGFFPLLLQQSDPQLNVVALDVSAPILELARDAAGSRHHVGTVTFVCGDACSLPFANRSFDTVTALHVLEHLAPSSASQTLQEMCRVARRRVIVAVPMEEELDPAYDHVQRFDREGLITIGEKTGWRCGFEDYLGGWVVLEPS